MAAPGDLCQCGHMIMMHEFGTGKKAQLRMRCSWYGPPGRSCGCKQCVPATPAEPQDKPAGTAEDTW